MPGGQEIAVGAPVSHNTVENWVPFWQESRACPNLAGRPIERWSRLRLVWLYVEHLVPIVLSSSVDEECWLPFESYSHHTPGPLIYSCARIHTTTRDTRYGNKKAQMRQRALYAAVKLVYGNTSQNASRTSLPALLWRTSVQQIHRGVVSITEVLTNRQVVIFT